VCAEPAHDRTVALLAGRRRRRDGPRHVAPGPRAARIPVTTAEDGKGGLGEIERETPDLLLLDIEMPGLDGMEILRSVRERFTSAELPSSW
jgi:CheY-like chemotaxis protein